MTTTKLKCEYRTDRQTDTHTQTLDKVIPMCRYASQVTQQAMLNSGKKSKFSTYQGGEISTTDPLCIPSCSTSVDENMTSCSPVGWEDGDKTVQCDTCREYRLSKLSTLTVMALLDSSVHPELYTVTLR